MSTTAQKSSTFKVHVHLEKLIKDKFGVFLEVYHDQFNPPIKNYRNKPIRARTTVMAYSSANDAVKASKEPGSVIPVGIAHAECSANDVFEKRVGLAKAYHRLYRVLAAQNK